MPASTTLSLASFLALSMGVGPVTSHAVPHPGNWRFHHAFWRHPGVDAGAPRETAKACADEEVCLCVDAAKRDHCAQGVGRMIHA